jgi:beta-glucosidase/6-phospho-beta-glucosidase/beta-galactosidase
MCWPILRPHMPEGWQDDFETIAQPLDWVGINYYTRKLIGPDGSDQFPFLEEREGPLEKTAMDWEIYPDGLLHFPAAHGKLHRPADLCDRKRVGVLRRPQR